MSKTRLVNSHICKLSCLMEAIRTHLLQLDAFPIPNTYLFPRKVIFPNIHVRFWRILEMNVIHLQHLHNTK
uniref:Uncharacterized protein n=1 Tax=Octopus bimaculoides TaxID=37653 RepID=A0A0L8H0Z7_OCTBM